MEQPAAQPAAQPNTPHPSGSSNMPRNAEKHQIDHSLYSRQLYVLGEEAMKRMAQSNILIAGLGGLGVEIAKNIILGGVKSVTLLDWAKTCYSDLSSQFYLSEASLNMNRAEACRDALAKLNSYVSVKVLKEKLSEKIIQKFQVIVLTDSSLEEKVRICDFAHSINIPVIVARTSGLFGQIFCDFGENFTVYDANGENPRSATIGSISNDTEGVVTVLDEETLGFGDDDFVRFSEVEGMTELNDGKPYKIKVLGPYMFTIGDTSSFSQYEKGGVATQLKVPKALHFQTLSESLNSPKFVITDYGKVGRSEQLHVAFKALDEFMIRKNRIPKPAAPEDAKMFVKICKTLKGDLDLDEELMKKFATACCGNLAPMNSVIGGIAAQEIMKACSGKFHPIFQWLHFDALECLPKDWTPKKDDVAPLQSRYDGQISVFGREFQQTLHKLRYFIVGAGAIGCELLKNFAMMGIGCEKAGGEIVIADMDLIEKSNLHRQFLFRSYDVHQPKALVAAEAVKAMNPEVKGVTHLAFIGPETEHIFNEEFFNRIDGVANALDTVESRIYVDSRCVLFKKPLLESGTLGTKGSTQVVVPYLTESYASSKDPPEKSTPYCTVKNSPTSIQHTLEWACDVFDKHFCHGPRKINKYLNDPDFFEWRSFFRPRSLKSLLKTLVVERPHTIQDCVKWARLQWEEEYHNRIMRLLEYFPPDSVLETGIPYWAPPKKCPHPLVFDINNPLHVDYVFAAANLKAQIHEIPQTRDRNAIIEMIQKVKVKGPNLVPPSASTFQSSSDNSSNGESSFTTSPEIVSQEQLLKENFVLRHLKFDKDDDTNLHVDFIMAASNLRAAAYNIPPADRLTSKLIAGKIIPAIATMTSVVAGLVCFELIKIAQKFSDLEVYKNGFINLALPFFTFSKPLAAPKIKYNETEWTFWDLFEVQGEISLEQFLRQFRSRYGVLVKCVTCNGVILYTTFMDLTELERRMSMSMSDVLRRYLKNQLDSHVRSYTFRLICTDKDGKAVEVPYVRYLLPPK